MTSQEMPRELVSLLKQLRAEYPHALTNPAECSSIDPAEPLLGHFVRAFLMWESTAAKAATAMKRIEQAVVDFNELRVCMPGELVRLMGERYPRVEERARRLRSALNGIYTREHKVSLERLGEMSKRESREYLETLESTPRYVAARVALVGLSGHMAPIDARMLRRLVERNIVEADATPETAAAALERKVRAAEMPECYALLQAWSDDGAAEGAEPARVAAPVSAKPETRKPAPKPKEVKPKTKPEAKR